MSQPRPTTPRTWAILDTRPQFIRDSRCTVLAVYDNERDAEIEWNWRSMGHGSHITPDCQRYVILELPLGVPVEAHPDEA